MGKEADDCPTTSETQEVFPKEGQVDEEGDDDDGTPPILVREEPTTEEDSSNVISISHEDLIEAGVNPDQINSLTTEQVNALVEINKKRQEEQTNSTDPVCIVLTDDGGLKVKDAANQVFFFPAQQLKAMNIDVNNLTSENITRIINEAIPAVQSEEGEEPIHEEIVITEVIENEEELIDAEEARSTSQPDELELISEEVEIRRQNGKRAVVTIRFIKPGGALKVQFEDGHFEWIGEDQIVQRRTTNDHENYQREIVQAEKQTNPLKRIAAGECRNPKRPNTEPNFCCPICENKVYQKGPSYIVIRIPACDSCTKEKVVVLDDERNG